MRLRVLTWNINGLRRIVAAFGGLTPLLEALGADVVCFQETKLTRGDLKRELALADGWESFFAFTRGRVGYSGVATFCRREATVPCGAEEGFTGAWGLSPGSRPSCASAAAQPHPRWVAAGFDADQLRILDGEGRVVITDHGGLVLVNVYGPAISSEERAEERMVFKIRFYQALQIRLDSLLAEGRRVVLLGDLNIAPDHRDVCGATPRDFDARRADRAWLRGLMTRGRGSGAADPRRWQPWSGEGSGAGGAADNRVRYGSEDGVGSGADCSESEAEEREEKVGALWGGGGSGGEALPFVDTFRAFYPLREHAYTCWNTSSGARVNNYGSRIDHILAADGTAAGRAAAAATAAGSSSTGDSGGGAGTGGSTATWCPPWVVAADIMPYFEGSDHAPAWVELELPDEELTRGSASGPPPPLSSRILFDATRQATLHSCLARRAVGSRTSALVYDGPLATGTVHDGAVDGSATGGALVATAAAEAEASVAQEVWDAARSVGLESGGEGASGRHPWSNGGSGEGGRFSEDGGRWRRPSGVMLVESRSGTTSEPLAHPPRGDGGGVRGRTTTTAAAAAGRESGGARGGSVGVVGGGWRKQHDPALTQEGTRVRGVGGGGAVQRKLTAFMRPRSADIAAAGPPPTQPSTDRSQQHSQPHHQQRHSHQQPHSEEHPHQHRHHHSQGHHHQGYHHHQQRRQQDQQPHGLQQPYRPQEQGRDVAGVVPPAPLTTARGAEQGPNPNLAAPEAPEGLPAEPRAEEEMFLALSVSVSATIGAAAAGSSAPGGGYMSSGSEPEGMTAPPEGPAGRSQAALAWRQIQDQMKPPRCSGHGEPCVVRTVKKRGENNGRQFWCCARPDGLPPHGRCEFFQWARGRHSVAASIAATASGIATGGSTGAAVAGKAQRGAGGGGARPADGSGGFMTNMPRKKPRT